MGHDSDNPGPRRSSAHPTDDFPGYDGLELAVLRRYVAGESDAAERRRVEAWAVESVERRHYLAAMQELRARAPAAAAGDAAAAWARIAARLERPAPSDENALPFAPAWEQPAVRVDVRRRRVARILGGAFPAEPRRRVPRLAAAAAIIAAIGIGALVLRSTSQRTAPAPVPAMRQIATTKGQRAEVQLGDGSRVVLGVESRMRFAADFGAGRRDIYLDGAAYFDVAHDSTRPFVVHTASAVTEDVGTQFVVTAYPGTGATRVVVVDGAVALREPHDPNARRVVLTRGRLGRLAVGDTTPTVQTTDPALYTAWMQGELVFRDAPLADAVAELRRWYAVDLRIGDPSIRSAPLTAAFAAESFREALTVVTTVLPLRAVRTGSIVTLYRR